MNKNKVVEKKTGTERNDRILFPSDINNKKIVCRIGDHHDI